jgi:hypothetical protein
MFFLNDKDNIIKISFKIPFYKDFYNLYFIPNTDIIYYDNSHLNYIYKEKSNDDNIEYTFHGFFKDNYFVIILDSFNENLQINVENKQIALINLEWVLKRINEEKSIWIIDNTKINNLSTSAYLLNIRKKILSTNIDINDYIKVVEYLIVSINIKNVNELEKEKKNNLFNIIKLYFNCSNNIT